MNSQQVLLGAALMLLCGAGLAQTADQPTAPAQGTTPMQETAPTPAPATPTPTNAPAPTPKMSGETQFAAVPGTPEQGDSTDQMSAQGSGKTKAAKSSTNTAKANPAPPAQIAMQDEKEYRNALRQCAREQEDTMRGSCLDNAIEQFGRNT